MLILTLIYLGNRIPRYVLKNLDYLRNTFPDDEIYFISDSKKSLTKARKKGVNTWLAPNTDEQWQGVKANLNHPMGFRDGFWFKTLARIFVLNSFMQLHPNQRLLQIEADVFLFPSFPISKFKNLDAEISFPMESQEMGIASVLFLRDQNSSEKLVRIAFREIEENGKLTDMSLLGKIAISHEMQFLPLQTLPADIPNALNEKKAAKLICNDSLDASGVFDGISVGQYLLGIDPRNSRGWLILHRNQPSHAINVDHLTLGLDSRDNLVLKTSKGDTTVFNLHNHAKDLRLFETKSRRKLLQKRVISSSQGERRELILKILISSVFHAIIRRVGDGFRRNKY